MKSLLKDDIEFLNEVLAKMGTGGNCNLHDLEDARMMLSDQIKHMEKRLVEPVVEDRQAKNCRLSDSEDCPSDLCICPNDSRCISFSPAT